MQPKSVQKLLGHGSLQLTMDLYCHVTEDTLFDEMAEMEQIWRYSKKCVVEQFEKKTTGEKPYKQEVLR